MIIYPVGMNNFDVTRFMKNAHVLKNCEVVNKYACKYIGKMGEQNNVVIYADG